MVISGPYGHFWTVYEHIWAHMDIYEYMKIKYDTIPNEIKEKYNLAKLKSDGYIYIEIQKGIYGLKHTGVLTNKPLESLLAKDGCIKTTFTPGLWKHRTRPIMFNLCVDDFVYNM